MKRKAFTIVELVIVIAVIAILVAVLIPSFSSVIEKAKGVKKQQEDRYEMIDLFSLNAQRVAMGKKPLIPFNETNEYYNDGIKTVENNYRLLSAEGLSKYKKIYIEFSLSDQEIYSLIVNGKNKYSGASSLPEGFSKTIQGQLVCITIDNSGKEIESIMFNYNITDILGSVEIMCDYTE